MSRVADYVNRGIHVITRESVERAHDQPTVAPRLEFSLRSCPTCDVGWYDSPTSPCWNCGEVPE